MVIKKKKVLFNFTTDDGQSLFTGASVGCTTVVNCSPYLQAVFKTPTSRYQAVHSVPPQALENCRYYKQNYPCLRYIYVKPKSTKTEFDIRIRNPVSNIKTNANYLYLYAKTRYIIPL